MEPKQEPKPGCDKCGCPHEGKGCAEARKGAEGAAQLFGLVEYVFAEWLVSPERGKNAMLTLFSKIPERRRILLAGQLRVGALAEGGVQDSTPG